MLSATNQTEIASGQLFDGRRVVPQAVGLLREPTVLLLEPYDRVSQMLIFASGPGCLNESPFAADSVGQQDSGCQEQEEFRQPSPDRRLRVMLSNLLCSAASGWPKGQEPLGPVPPSCCGGTGGLWPGAPASGQQARARHARSCFGRTGDRG